MRKPILLLLTGFLFSIGSLFAQGLQIAALPMVVNGMAAHNVYESETIGIANARSKQFERYQQLISIATKEQLLDLAGEHTNAVVRLYAFQALRERNISIPKSLQQKFKDDETIVPVLEGCVANKFPLNKLAATQLSAKNNWHKQNFTGTSFVNQ